MAELSFPQEEYEARWAKVHEEMKKRGYDVAVIWGRSAGTHERCADPLYLTNFYSSHSCHEPECPLWTARSFAAVVMQLGETPALHMDEPLEDHSWIATDRIHWHMDPIKGVGDDLKGRGVSGKVAIVGSDFFPFKYMRELESLTPNIEWAVEDDLVQVPRRIKSPRELDVFREAGETVTLGLNAMMEGLIAGKPEREAAAEAAKIVIARGGVPTLIRVQHGKGKEMMDLCREPLTGASADAPKPGDMVRAYLMGPMAKGYWLDPFRTAVCGNKPTPEQKRLIEDCGDIIEAVLAAVRPGVRVKALAKIGDELHRKAGGERDQASLQWPLYGHGNGLFFEGPIFGEEACDDDDVIEENMVGSSECFLARSGIGAAGFEQNYIVTKDGIELITKTPMYYWE